MPQSDLDELTGRTIDGVSRAALFLQMFEVIKTAAHEGVFATSAFTMARQLWGVMQPAEQQEVLRSFKSADLEIWARVALAAPPCRKPTSINARQVVTLCDSVRSAFSNYLDGTGFDAKQLAAEVPKVLDENEKLRTALGQKQEALRSLVNAIKIRAWFGDVSALIATLSTGVEAILDPVSDQAAYDNAVRAVQHAFTTPPRDSENKKLREDLARAQAFIEKMPGESQESISRWAEHTFGPSGSNARAVARANREMSELLEHVTADDHHHEAAEEIADIMIVLYRVATRLGVDLHDVIDQKMSVNRARKWKLDGTGHGYHVKESAE